MPNQIRIEGNLGRDIELRYTANGNPVAKFSVAGDSPRRKDQHGEWEDAGPTWWARCELWGPEAERLNDAAVKGDRLLVFGHIKAEEWQDKTTGEKRFGQTVAVDAVKVLPRRGQRQQQAQPQQDPWGEQQPAFGHDQEPPF